MFDFVNVESLKNPVTEETIAGIEQEYGIQFPPLLRQYYLEHNGQRITPVTLLVNGEIREVGKITQIRDPRLSLEQLLHMQRLQDFPVRQMIPIADDRANGTYYYHTGTGTVYYSELQDENDFQPVCQGIDAFFRILDAAAAQDDPDNPYDVLEDDAGGARELPDFLPLGSVVQLRGARRRVMIVSRMIHISQKEEVYRFDYGGVIYPNGHTGDSLVYFNREGIDKVIFRGCADSEDDAMQIALKHYLVEHQNENIGKPGLIKE